MNNSILHEIGVFSSLNPDEIDFVHTLMEASNVPAGEFLFREGEEGRVMHVLLSGRVRVSVKVDNGDEVEVSKVDKGGFFGEMSLLEKSSRSASCQALEDCELLSLDHDGFNKLLNDHPSMAMSIMERMLSISSRRLENTDSFLTDIVRWGEDARIRAVTDDFTGLYNRRFFDTAIEEAILEWKNCGQSMALAIVDLDRFGLINAEYGESTANRILLSVVEEMTKVFGDKSIIARYGGDEFAIILSDSSGKQAMEMAKQMNKSSHSIDILHNKKGSLTNITVSIGISVCPGHGTSPKKLLDAADLALYSAKKKGRNQAVVYDLLDESRKVPISGIGTRRRIINNLIGEILRTANFLLVGHIEPDQDCFSSMVAVALILKKFNKNARIVLEKSKQNKFTYLLSICRYNSIEVIGSSEKIPQDLATVIALDTPKPSMLQFREEIEALISQPGIRVMEIDHHIAADGSYIGNESYCFVDSASSCCELIGELFLYLNSRKNILNQYNINNIFTRNIVLAVITGMVGDAKMGQFLSTKRQKRRFKHYSRLFSNMLKRTTKCGSGNLSSIEDIMHSIEELVGEDEQCFRELLEYEKNSGAVSWLALDENDSADFMERYQMDTMITVAKYSADELSEKSGFVGMVSYYDTLEKSEYIQLRMRRNHAYRSIDLRELLGKIGITNGGGHEGAVGFRVNKNDVNDYESFIDGIIQQTAKFIQEAEEPH